MKTLPYKGITFKNLAAFLPEMKSLTLAALILLASCSTLKTVTRETVLDRYQATRTDEFREDGTLKRTTIETHSEGYGANPTTVEVMITYDYYGYPLLQIRKINLPRLDQVHTYTTAFTVDPQGNIKEEVTLTDFGSNGRPDEIQVITYREPGKPVRERLLPLRDLHGGIDHVITGVLDEAGMIRYGFLDIRPSSATLPPYLSGEQVISGEGKFCSIERGEMVRSYARMYSECLEKDYTLKGLLTPELRERFEREGLLNP